MNKRIKILQAIRQGKVGGGETHVLDLVTTLDSDRFESVVLSFTEGPMVDRLRVAGFKTYVVPTETPFNYKVWGSVKQIVIDEKIDIIHAHGTRANSNTFFSAKSLKIPLIYTVHGWSFHPDQRRLVNLIRTLSERFLVMMATRTICVSESNLNEGRMKFPMPNSVVIVNGINQEKFNPDLIYPEIRSSFGVNQCDILVGYIARVTGQKDPLTFLHAVSKIPLDLNARFLIVGDGDLKDEAVSLAKSLDLTQRVRFENFRADIPAVLNSIDIFCLPSLWEGLPIALLEAMAMRKAIVATDIDGTTDLLNDMENGILVPPGNPEKLASALRSLILDKQLRDNLGIRAAETVQQKFDIDTMVKKIQAQYFDTVRAS